MSDDGIAKLQKLLATLTVPRVELSVSARAWVRAQRGCDDFALWEMELEHPC